MEHKSFPVETKAEGDAGEFTALVSVFNNVDLVGDRVLPGAFAKSIERLKESGNPLPIILSHNHDDIWAHIGAAHPDDVVETTRGLEVTGKLDIKDNPVAKQAFKLMKEKRLREFSFAYTVPKGGQEKDEKGVNELKEIDLFEAGPTLKGANPDTELQAVKSALKESETKEVPANRVVGDGVFPPGTTFRTAEGSPVVKYTVDSKKLAEEKEAPPFLEPDSVITTDEHGNIEKIEDKTARVQGVEEESSRACDPLRKRSEDLALEVASGGMSRRPPPKVKPEEPPPEPLSERELRRRSTDLLMEILSG